MKNKIFYLMHKNIKVLKVEILLYYQTLTFGNIEIINKKHLPIILKDEKGDLIKWFKNRFYDTKTNEIFKILDLINYNQNDKNLKSLYTLSFINYCVSLNDNYWFNPEEEYIIENSIPTRGDIDDFIIKPTTWENINYFNKKFDTAIGDIIEKVYYKQIRDFDDKLDYKTPDLLMFGSKNKRYIIEDNEIYVKKFANKKHLDKCFQIYEKLKEIKSPFILEQEFNFEKEYVKSKFFLNKDEDYVESFEIVIPFMNQYKNQDDYKFLKQCAIKLGCPRHEINKYFKTIKCLEKELGIKYDNTNIGFIVDSNTNKIKRCAPIR